MSPSGGGRERLRVGSFQARIDPGEVAGRARGCRAGEEGRGSGNRYSSEEVRLTWISAKKITFSLVEYRQTAPPCRLSPDGIISPHRLPCFRSYLFAMIRARGVPGGSRVALSVSPSRQAIPQKDAAAPAPQSGVAPRASHQGGKSCSNRTRSRRPAS